MRVDFSAVQIALVLVIALLVFGPHRLPEIGRQVGRGIREARRQITEVGNEISQAHPESQTRASSTATVTASASTPPPPVTTAPVPDDDDADLLEGVVVAREGGAASPDVAVETADAAGDPDDDEALLHGVVLSGDTPPDHRA